MLVGALALACGQALAMGLPARAVSTSPASLPASAAATQPATQAAATQPEGIRAVGQIPLYKSPSSPTEIDTSKILFQMLAYVLVILVLGGVGLYVVRKVMPKIASASGKNMSLLETTYLGPRKMVQLVQVGRRRFLVASSREHVTPPVDVTDAFEWPVENQPKPSQVAVKERPKK